MGQQKFVEAEASLRESLRLEPTDPRTPELLNRALAGQGKPAETEPRLSAISDEDPPEPEAKEQPD